MKGTLLSVLGFILQPNLQIPLHKLSDRCFLKEAVPTAQPLHQEKLKLIQYFFELLLWIHNCHNRIIEPTIYHLPSTIYPLPSTLLTTTN